MRVPADLNHCQYWELHASYYTAHSWPHYCATRISPKSPSLSRVPSNMEVRLCVSSELSKYGEGSSVYGVQSVYGAVYRECTVSQPARQCQGGAKYFSQQQSEVGTTSSYGVY